ncbi:hypothetical protein [Nocardia iowensis]|nr:hypothetical protein [Nocardia iowensis]
MSNWIWLWTSELHRYFRLMNPGGPVRGALDGGGVARIGGRRGGWGRPY